MSMEELQHLYWRQLGTKLGGIAGELTKMHFTSWHAREPWHPPINAYCCRDRILICAELAGVDRSEITLTVEPRRVWLRGQRTPPEPHEEDGPASQVLAMEIDDGEFEREIVLPVAVNPDQVKAEQRAGLLWITLPLATQR